MYLPDKIFITGNTVIDALYWVVEKSKVNESISQTLNDLFAKYKVPVHEYESGKRKLVLVTGHRRENFGKGFINICEALRELANSILKSILFILCI